ncbi:uncharacterized protein LOC112533251 [Gallus gallus]|uniref:uncharacterized protein LOC112533251 n=1 Tax=Gallus gallus TaxID=9031 RepID=UPI001F0189EC|nr:uncharacterized protein LOC112533251 [Gallus gallus]
MSSDMEEIGQLVQTVLESTALGKDSEEMQQQEGFFLNLLHEEGAVKVTVHWEVDEWSPAGGVAAEDEHPGSFTAGAMTLALFSAGNENHLLSLNQRSFSGKKTQILMWFLICMVPQKVTQWLVKKGWFSGTGFRFLRANINVAASSSLCVLR